MTSPRVTAPSMWGTRMTGLAGQDVRHRRCGVARGLDVAAQGPDRVTRTQDGPAVVARCSCRVGGAR